MTIWKVRISVIALCLNIHFVFAHTDPLQQAANAEAAGDYTLAVKLYSPLAEAGNADAQFNLAELIDEGKGTLEDERLALRWYLLAANQGHTAAQSTLGSFYLVGRGVELDYIQALKWCRIAAAAGDPQAQFNLGWMYSMGYGLTKDPVRAYVWTKLAASNNHSERKAVYTRSLRSMEPTLTSAELGQVQELEAKCKASPDGVC